jgi:hypothetical protein
MNPYSGIPEYISLKHIMFKFSLLVREENVNICSFAEFYSEISMKIPEGT